MKWKTSTIITILVVSVGIIAFSQYEKIRTIETLERATDEKIKEGLAFEKKKIGNQFEERIKNCDQQNEDLKKEIEELTEKVRFIRYGGENEYYINQIKANSTKSSEKYKIRKGEVFRHKDSDIVVYIKRDFYDDQVLLNLTLPNKKSEEWDWQTGKFYYYWNAQRNELNQVLPTFIGENHLEIEWSHFKAKSNFDNASK